ncbi:MAG: hypothetical protein EBX50_08330 [Chitinophagia bacterium]|nr:hypothetical protein [Chitinophagia bacterium]
MKLIVNKKTSTIWVAFIVFSVLTVLGWNSLAIRKINPWVILISNGILCLVTLLNIAYHSASLQQSNPQAVLRSVMASTMIKLFVLAASVLIYLLAAGSSRSVYAIILSMGLYIIYSWMETKILLQLKKAK